MSFEPEEIINFHPQISTQCMEVNILYSSFNQETLSAIYPPPYVPAPIDTRLFHSSGSDLLC